MSRENLVKDKLSDELRRALKTVVDHFDKEDQLVRQRQLRTWKKMKYYWVGMSRLWWSEVAHDWRVYDLQNSQNLNDAAFYDKPVNVFRAYLESIIAVLSVTLPSIKCLPDNSDEPTDRLTAKAGDKIAELVGKHNDIKLLWIHALFIYCTEGMVACYSYPKEDKKFGEYSKPKYENEEQEEEQTICSNCQQPIDNFHLVDDEKDEFSPGEDDVQLHDKMNNEGKEYCSNCMAMVDTSIVKNKFIVRRLTGVTSEPKTRMCMEAYGGLNVKVPNYARKQSECPYLIYTWEDHYTCAVDKYPALKGLYKEGGSAGGMYDPFERWARISPQYWGEYPMNVGTWRHCWLRPSAFNVLADEDQIKALKKRFPDGAKVVYWNDQYCESENESLDDCWTLAYNPLSDYVHYDPHGLLLTSVQEITNDLINLTLQTIEHGIPQTFADPEVLNFQQYRETEASPGSIFPAKAKSGKSISDGFYEVKTATLSQEVQPFAEKVEQLGQFTSGAQPSLFGGQQEQGSKTAAVYSMSRAQSLQRLQTPWQMFCIWWKNIHAKVIPAYIKEMQEDEHFTKMDALGNPITVMIKRAEVEGKIGSIELEASEALPASWAQKKDVIMQLLQAPNPAIQEVIFAPENSHLLSEAIGLTDFELPNEEDIAKQYEEIGTLINSQPIMGPQGEMPSVDIDVMVDNHKVEADICRRWLVSEAGRQAKTEKPKGYRNVLLHMQHHMIVLQKNQAVEQQQQVQGKGKPPQKGQVPPQKAPQDNPTEGDPQNASVH